MSENKTPMTVEEFEEKMQAMFDMANKKADDIISTAEKKAKKILSDAAKSIPDRPSAKKPREERMVSVRLPRDSQKGDRIISVNGKPWQIQRGVTVQVPLSVYEIIESSDRQDDIAAAYAESLQSDFTDKLESIN